MEGTVSTNLYHVHKIFCAQLYLKFARIVMGANFSELQGHTSVSLGFSPCSYQVCLDEVLGESSLLFLVVCL